MCGKTPKTGYACGEYFIIGNGDCIMCQQSYTPMHSSEDSTINAWNRFVDLCEVYKANVTSKKQKSTPVTNYEKIKSMSVDEMATAINNGISTDPCDYCAFNNHYCDGTPCRNKAETEIIAEWLESEVKK